MNNRYTVEQLIAKHIGRYTNVSPSDIGLWVYIISGRAYGFTTTKDEAIARAELGVGKQ